MAARRAEVDGQTVSFDHGTQAFFATHDSFRATVDTWNSAGFVAPWQAAGEGAWVGTPGMNAPLRAMAEPLGVQWGNRVEAITSHDGVWMVANGTGEAQFSDVAIAIPAEQAAVLCAEAAPQLADLAKAVQSDPSWTVMASFAEALPIDGDFHASDDANKAIRRASRNSAKPGRSGFENWVIQASASLSQSILELDADEAAKQVLAVFFAQNGVAPVDPIHLVAHRWRYAFPLVNGPLAKGRQAIWDDAARIGICGDYCVSPDVEGAWLSGRALAEQIILAG